MNATAVSVIGRDVDGVLVSQRAGDGFVNATELCKAAGKLFGDYRRLATTGEFLGELASDMGIPISELVESRKGQSEGQIRGSGQGTWVHPDVAIHLAQWCSAKFAVMVSRWVRELLTTGSVGDDSQRIDRLEQQVGQMATAITGLAGVVGGLVESVKALSVTISQPQAMIGRQGQSFNVADRCRFMGWVDTTPKQRAKVRQRVNSHLSKYGDVPDVKDRVHYYSGHQLFILDQSITEIRSETEKQERATGPNLFSRISDRVGAN